MIYSVFLSLRIQLKLCELSVKLCECDTKSLYKLLRQIATSTQPTVPSVVLYAGAIVAWTFGTIYILSSINVLIAHKHGAKDIEGISLIFCDGMLLALLLSLPSFLLFWNLASLLAMAGQSPIILNLATSYLHAMAWGLLPNFIVLAVLEVMIRLFELLRIATPMGAIYCVEVGFFMTMTLLCAFGG